MSTNLPNADELQLLPLRSAVAYAVRVVMRAINTLGPVEVPPDKIVGRRKTTGIAVLIAESFCKGTLSKGSKLHEIYDQNIWKAEQSDSPEYDIFESMAGNLLNAATECAFGHRVYRDVLCSSCAKRTIEACVEATFKAANAFSVADHPQFSEFMILARRDFEKLLAIKQAVFPQAGPPIHVSDDGPLGLLWGDFRHP